MDEAVIPECYIDTTLIETLVPPVRRYNHQHGCGAVTTVMKRHFADQFALAIIDRDKRQVQYLNEFDIIADCGALLLHKHKKRLHYIIQINPAMERFIMDNAAKCGLSLEDFGLPGDFERLKKATKTTNTKNNPNFKRLFRELLRRNPEDFQRLQAWITYLKNHPYDADPRALAQM